MKVVNTGSNKRNKEVVCMSEIQNTQIVNAKDILCSNKHV